MNIFPLFYSLYLSFTDYRATGDDAPKWVGLQNYSDILNDEKLWLYFQNTGRYVVLSVGLQTVVGFGMALLLRKQFKGKRFGDYPDPDPDDVFANCGGFVLETHVQPRLWFI